MSKSKFGENVPAIPKPQPKTNKKITPEIIATVEKFYRHGLSEASIAGIVGVKYQTLVMWLMKGMNDTGLGFTSEYQELYERAAKAKGTNELEFLSKMREFALGSPAEYAYDEVISPDGTITKTVVKDKEGNPVIKKHEIPSNPSWVAWYLERKFHKAFGRKNREDEDESISGIENANNNSMSQKLAPVPLTQAEKLDMLDRYKEKVLKDVEASKKEANE